MSLKGKERGHGDTGGKGGEDRGRGWSEGPTAEDMGHGNTGNGREAGTVSKALTVNHPANTLTLYFHSTVRACSSAPVHLVTQVWPPPQNRAKATSQGQK